MNSSFTRIHLKLGGVKVDFDLRFPETQHFLRRYLLAGEPTAPITVCVSDWAFRDWERAGNSIDAFGEFCLLCQPCSEALMDFGHCVFHAFALRYHDRAFLIAGGSGAGKSTHGKLLLEQHPEEFSVINGDKPVLEILDDRVIVHPSPWNGKEGLRGAEAAPLAGIFFLRRSDQNFVKPLTWKEAALCVFPMVFQSFENETVIRKTGAFTEQIIQRTSCFLLSSCDAVESSALICQAIKGAANDEL